MANITFISGGCRSGKSDFAQNYAEKLVGNKTYIANAPLIDNEIKDRAKKHQEMRSGKGWCTIEEQVDLKNVFLQNKSDIWLLDCVTMWINNLQYFSDKNNTELNENDIVNFCNELIKIWSTSDNHIIIVSDEIGMGLIPADKTSRVYRDLLGRANQVFAAIADKAYFVVSGIPLQIKG